MLDYFKCVVVFSVGFTVFVVAPLTFFYFLYKVLAFLIAL